MEKKAIEQGNSHMCALAVQSACKSVDTDLAELRAHKARHAALLEKRQNGVFPWYHVKPVPKWDDPSHVQKK